MTTEAMPMPPGSNQEATQQNNTELTAEQEKFVEEFLSRPTSLPTFEAQISGFATEADALKVWEWVRGYLDAFGRQMSLEKLHKLTISDDYAGALAKVERAIGPTLKATQDEFATGVAMAAPVIVEGVPKTHLVLFSGTIAPIAEPEHDYHKMARYILAHECGHIHDLAQLHRAFGERLLKPEATQRAFILQSVASGCWSEYAACRLSACWAHDEETTSLQDTFCSFLEGLRMRGKEALWQYQQDRELGNLLNFIADQYGKAMRYASYLFGHLRGFDLSVAEGAPKAFAMMDKKVFFRQIFQELETCLNMMWSAYGEWTDIAIFEPLKKLVDDCLKVGGLTLETVADGQLYVHVSRHVTLFSTEDE